MCSCLKHLNEAVDIVQSNNIILVATAVAAVIGCLFLAKFALCLVLGLLKKLTLSSKLAKYKKQGSWAVITGATDGIGLAFAQILHKRGWNVLLVSRTEKKLKDVISGLDGSAQSEYLAIDFSNATDADYALLKNAVKDKDVGLLINNVGVGYGYPEYFDQVDDTVIRDICRVNIEATMFVTKAILPKMVEQKRGLVLSVSSGSSILPTCPLLSVYAASKAFLNNWTPSMNAEYKSKGITFETLTPFYIVSKLSKFKRPSMTIPTPETYVKSVLASIGNFSLHTGYMPHTVMGFIANHIFPYFYAESYTRNLHLKARSVALKKKAEEKKTE